MNQPAPGSTFDGHWLRLRESADHAARDSALTRRASEWLKHRRHPQRALSLVDLGSGSGSNLQFLAPRLPANQRWRLVDHDPRLLDQAIARCSSLRDAGGNPIEAIGDCRNLTELNAASIEGSDLICASALFDLVSRDWLERLADACEASAAAVLFTLSVNGEWRFIDRHGQAQDNAEDRWVRRWVNIHQQRDKGFGKALGGGGGAALIAAFSRRGYRIASAPSPWLLLPGHAEDIALARALLDGWVQAAAEQAPQSDELLTTWLADRCRALDDGMLGLWVGHDDVFACPPNHTGEKA
nr:class I SAM-dependent methyltransferase [uncultured Halomonas sp.]